MLVVLQLLTIVGMILATFYVYQALGPRRANFTYSKEEKAEWDSIAGNDLGSWLTVCNIFASITSLATVYVFFIGNTRLFGWWILVPLITIWAGAFVTNHITKLLLSKPHILQRLTSADQSAAALPSLILDGTSEGVKAASIVRYISLANITAIIWMEFSVFADISSQLIAPGSITAGVIFLFACTFSVIYFTLKYGLRGFVFADLFHSPLIAFGSIALLVGSFAFLLTSLTGIKGEGAATLLTKMAAEMSNPKIPFLGGVLFLFAAIFLNSFFVLVTEPHWLRVWMFGKKESNLQVTSLSVTCVVWAILIVLGALASVAVSADAQVSPHIVGGDSVVIYFLGKMAEVSPLFAVAFWIAGMAALFSTSDAQVYSFLLIERFSPSIGRIGDASFDKVKPAFHSAAAALLFSAAYLFVRKFELPFEQLVLLLLPSCLNIVPALILAIRGAPQSPALL